MSEDVERRRKVRSTALRLTLFALAVYILFIVVFVSRGQL